MKKILVLLSIICLAVPLSIGMVGCGLGGSSQPEAPEDDGTLELSEEDEALEEGIGMEDDEPAEE